ncbi:hypothetical protein Vi05172_g11126 [Venturia inaequalis]|nr:hypothetical protein Vi05172_g11126 [Venturia inaequalis]
MVQIKVNSKEYLQGPQSKQQAPRQHIQQLGDTMAGVRKFDAEEERPRSSLQAVPNPYSLRLESNVGHHLTSEEEERVQEEFSEKGRSRQNRDAENLVKFEEKLDAGKQVEEFSRTAASSSQPNVERVGYGFKMSKRAPTTVESVRSIPVTSLLSLDEIEAVSEQEARSFPPSPYRPFTFAPPASEIPNPFAPRQPSRVTDYPSRVASSMVESTFPFHRQSLQEVHSSSPVRSFTVPEQASQNLNQMPGMSRDGAPDHFASCWIPSAIQRVPHNGLPTIEESYEKIFERSNARPTSKDPFPRHHEQRKRFTTPESLPALKPGTEDEDEGKESYPPPPRRRRRDEQEPISQTSQFTQNSMQEAGNVQPAQQAFREQPSLFSEDPKERDAWVRKNVAPRYVSPFSNPVPASASSLDRPSTNTNTSEISTPCYVNLSAQQHYSSIPTYPNPFSRHVTPPLRDQSSQVLPYSSFRSSVYPHDPCDPTTCWYGTLYPSWPHGADMKPAGWPFVEQGSNSQSGLNMAAEPLESGPSVRSVRNNHWDELNLNAPFIKAREMAEAMRSQAAMMAAAHIGFEHRKQSEEARDMIDVNCGCGNDSADEYFDPEVDGEDVTMSFKFADDENEEVDSAAKDDQSSHEETEYSSEEAEQTSELLKAEQETDSEDGSYASCSDSDSDSEDGDLEDSDSEDSDYAPTGYGQGSDSEHSESEYQGSDSEESENSSDQDDMESNASTATLQHEIPDASEVPDGDNVGGIEKVPDAIGNGELEGCDWLRCDCLHKGGVNMSDTEAQAENEERVEMMHYNHAGMDEGDKDVVDYSDRMTEPGRGRPLSSARPRLQVAPAARAGYVTLDASSVEQTESTTPTTSPEPHHFAGFPQLQKQREHYYKQRAAMTRRSAMGQNSRKRERVDSIREYDGQAGPLPQNMSSSKDSQDNYADQKETISAATTPSQTNLAIQDYQMQLKLFEQESKRGLITSRQEREGMTYAPASSRASPSRKLSTVPNFAALDAALDRFRVKVTQATDAMGETVDWIGENSKYEEGKIPAAPLDGRGIEKRLDLKRRTEEQDQAVWPAAEVLKTSTAKQLDDLPKINKVQATYAEEKQQHFRHILQGMDTYRLSVTPSLLSEEQINKQLMEARMARRKARRFTQHQDVKRHAPEFWNETIVALDNAVGFWQSQQTLRKYDRLGVVGAIATETPRDNESIDSDDEPRLTALKRKAEDFCEDEPAKKRAPFAEDLLKAMYTSTTAPAPDLSVVDPSENDRREAFFELVCKGWETKTDMRRPQLAGKFADERNVDYGSQTRAAERIDEVMPGVEVRLEKDFLIHEQERDHLQRVKWTSTNATDDLAAKSETRNNDSEGRSRSSFFREEMKRLMAPNKEREEATRKERKPSDFPPLSRGETSRLAWGEDRKAEGRDTIRKASSRRV